MALHIALLRGINVGGHNKIKMSDLKTAFEEIGLTRVKTYIQSGNILFESDEGEAALRGRIERQIESVFGLAIRVVLRTPDELRRLAAGCPFGEDEIAAAKASSEGECLYVSMMLDEPPQPNVDRLNAFDSGADRYVISGRDVYLLFSRSVRDSKLSIQVEKLNPPATVRNWRTISKLIELAEEMEAR